MNVKYFFVKNFKEYFSNTKEIFKALGLENFDTISEFEIPDKIYSQVVTIHHQKYNLNLDEIYEGELYGETGIDGLKIDFNFGLRLDIPKGNFHVKISDFETETIFFNEDISDCRLISSEQYFINWRVEVFLDGEKIFEHFFDVENQNILMTVPVNILGDTIAILPYVREFQRIHRCKVFLYLPKYLREIAKHFLPEIEQVEKITQEYYATFYLSGNLGAFLTLPVDSRTIPLEKVGEFIFGIHKTPTPLKFSPTQKRKIPEKYVCISIQGSGTMKGWHYPKGWEIVCNYLKKLGYKICCIDKNKIEKGFGYENKIPKNAKNFCGNIPLIERANMLYYADFFIGLSSGLSWMANVVGCPVIMICGFSETWYEFSTPYRVKNNFVCGGCFNDTSVPPFNFQNFCKKYRGTDREMECQKKISPRQVISAIEKLIADKNLKIPVAE